MKKIKILTLVALTTYPFSVFAITAVQNSSSCPPPTPSLCTLIESSVSYLNSALVVIVGISVVVFVYYIFKFFIKANEKHDEAGKYVMYSLIGFFVMLSLWGLVNILQNTFKLDNSSSQKTWNDIRNIIPK